MMLKSNKGLSLVTMVMTVLIMLILLSTLTYTAYTNLKIRGLNKLYNDIRTLNDEVAVYYLENSKLPVTSEYITITVGDELASNISYVTNDGTFTSQDSLVNPNDYNDESGTGQATYYVIDLGLFDNISLENYGKYIINEQSHMIYYVDGVTLNGTTYHNLPLNYKDTEYNLKHPVDSVTVKDVYLPMGGSSVSLQDYMTFTSSDGTTAAPKSIEYSVETPGYASYFSISNGVITSKTDASATTSSFVISATISSYGTTETKDATLTVYLTDIKLLDSNATDEISTLNMIKGDTKTLYVQKLGNAGTLKLLAKVDNGNGIDASISDSLDSSTNCYPLTIKASNSGKVYLTVIENNGKATRVVTVNVYDPALSSSSISCTSLSESKELTLTIGNDYEDDTSRFEINWSILDTSVATITESSSNELKATIIPVGFGKTTAYCEIVLDGVTLTTLECSVTVTGVYISDASLTVGTTKSPSYQIDDNISSSTISEISLTSSNTTVLEITDNLEFSPLSAGTSTVTIEIKLTSGITYTDTCTVTVNE